MSGFAQLFGDEKPQTLDQANAPKPSVFSQLFDQGKSPSPVPGAPVTEATAGPSMRSAITGNQNPVDEFAKHTYEQLANGQADDTPDVRKMLTAHGYSEADINKASMTGLGPRMSANSDEAKQDFYDSMSTIWNHPQFNQPIISRLGLDKVWDAVKKEHAANADDPTWKHTMEAGMDKLVDLGNGFTSPKALAEMYAIAGLNKFGALGKSLLGMIGLATVAKGVPEAAAGAGHLSAEAPNTPEQYNAVQQTVEGIATTGLGVGMTIPGVLKAAEMRDARVAEAQTKSIQDQTMANGGGTFDLAKGMPAKLPDGFIVGKVAGNFATVEPNDAAGLHKVLGRLKEKHPNALAGTWVNDAGKIVVDPVEHMVDKYDALKAGAERGQEAIYDTKAQKVVEVPQEMKTAFGIKQAIASSPEGAGAVTASGLQIPQTTIKGLLAANNNPTLPLSDVQHLSPADLVAKVSAPDSTGLTGEAYKLGESLTTEERITVGEKINELKSNKPTDMQGRMDSAYALQFYDEAAKLHDALQSVKGGTSVPKAATEFGVSPERLADAHAHSETFEGKWASGSDPEHLFNAIQNRTVETAGPVATEPAPGGDTGGLPPKESVFNTAGMPPNSDPVEWPAISLSQRLSAWWEHQWPRDAAMIKANPNTYALSGFQSYRNRLLSSMQDFTKHDWYQALRKLTPEQFIEDEHTAMYTYKQLRSQGMDAPKAFEEAMNKIRPETAQFFRHRQEVAPLVQDALGRLGQTPFDLVDGPYAPRLTTENYENVVNIRNGGTSFANALRTTVAGFGKSREHLTMKDGLANGTQYVDPIRAIWLRELTDAKVVETARLIDEYKTKGVLFPTEEAAAASNPNAEPWKVRNFGGGDYWTATKEEAQWLDQNMKQTGSGEFGKLNTIANALARNPNLVNPLPHAAKNMFFKYALGRVREASIRSAAEDFKNSTPSELRSRFGQVMSMGQGNTTISQMNAEQVGTFTDKLLNTGLKLNSLSTKFTFGVADPALRYSLWKSYVANGMTDQQAANNVWLDLVRYDVRSGAVDFWKSVPANFFTAWRVGSVVSLAKSAASNPIRTAMFIGAVDYLREMRYRATGKWTHMPHDYLEGPISTLKDDPKALPSVVATTAFLGPGGSQAPSLITDAMKMMKGDPQVWGRLRNSMWGLSVLYEVPREFNAYERTGDANHLVNVLTSAALAEHSSLNYAPRRLASALPEWMPGMQKSAIVQQSERMQAMKQAAADRKNARPSKPILPALSTTTDEDQLAQMKRNAR